jgi:hypothetical protein
MNGTVTTERLGSREPVTGRGLQVHLIRPIMPQKWFGTATSSFTFAKLMRHQWTRCGRTRTAFTLFRRLLWLFRGPAAHRVVPHRNGATEMSVAPFS